MLGVLYLLFNEGYSATAGADLVRQNLSAEAIRLARVLARLMPDEPEAAGLLALMLLHDARRAARLDADGDLVTLEDQDRARGTPRRSARASRCLRTRCGAGGRVRTRCRRPSPPATSPRPARSTPTGPQIAALYGQLAQFLPTPVVELNRAVAVGMAEGPEAGLALVDALEASGQLAGYHLLPATKADCPAPPRPPDEAAACYREALDWPAPTPSGATCSRRLAETGSG